ncbi:hypothetical protein [Halorarius halobius]|uniref:hypothetical protein n=1 Tax=Halorarius halobius TaxID=2962671 RepID=UPI0020CCBD7C|nr:hypothetical protein [Halorarius halobius]
MVPRSAASVALAALLVLAGCNALPADPTAEPSASPTVPETPAGTPTPTATATQTPEPTATPAPAVRVRDGSLAFDPNRTFGRVEQLLGRTATPPTVTVLRPTGGSGEVGLLGPLSNRLGLGARVPNWSDARAGGYIREGDVNLVRPASAPPAVVEAVLAHEFVHILQAQTPAYEAIDDRTALNAGLETDRRLAARAVKEGVATHVASVYARRHLDTPTEYENVAGKYRTTTPGGRAFLSAYYHGTRYVRAHLDDPADAERLYRRPPATTEQMLHPSVEESPRPLSVNASVPGWERVRTDTKGELVVRLTLQTELDRNASVRAAAGWGNDTALRYERGDRTAFVWLLRWDSAADADEFAAAAERFGNREEGVAVRRVSNATVGLVVGPDSFREATTLAGEKGDVRVRLNATARS